MYLIPECDNCKKELLFDNDEFYDGDSDVILYRAYGYCPKCGKRYTWLDHFEISHYSELKEIE